MEKIRTMVSSIRVSLLLSVCAGLAVGQLMYLLCLSGIDSRLLDLMDPRPDSLVFSGGRRITLYFGESDGPRRESEVIDEAAFKRLLTLRSVSPIAIFGVSMIATVAAYYRLKLRRPIRGLSESVDRIARRELDFTVPPAGLDELGRLCAAFESMRGELDSAFRSLWDAQKDQKSLYRAFAHDLRTPLTIIGGSVEIIRDVAAKKGDWAQALEAADQAQYAARRIEQYADQLRTLESLDSYPVAPVQVDLGEFGEELRRQFEILARTFHRSPQTSLQAQGTALLDRAAALRILDNLLQNALEHAEKAVSLEVALLGDTLSLTVEDDGAGFPPDALRNAAAPFFTTDLSGAHMGIGLTVACKLAERCEGSVRLRNGEVGAVAILTLPVR